MAKHKVLYCSNPKLHGAGYADGGPVFDRLNYSEYPSQVGRGLYSDTPGGGNADMINAKMDSTVDKSQDSMIHQPPMQPDLNTYPGDSRYVPWRLHATRRKM